MIKKNFFLTDLMKTGDHQSIEHFLSLADIAGEKIEYTGEYYTLHNFNLKKYDRLFAMIDHQNANDRLWKNKEYWNDLKERIELLKQQGFVFILSHPWESEDNMKERKYYDELLKETRCHTWSGGVNWFWFLMQEKHRDKKYSFNHTNKLYDFLYLNKQDRPHRKKLFAILKTNNLLDNSLYSFLHNSYNIKLNKQYELPWIDADNYPLYGSDQDIHEPQFNDTAINLVSETNDNDYDVFMTEKIWKPIIAKQVFVVHGNYGYLKKLKQLGFRTFNNVFDESYDDERDSDKRTNKIIDLCKILKNIDKQKLYRETESIRQHNQKLFFDKKELSKSINETVSGFLKLADRS
jgi:hypothetical protein